jgi:hypothetical protein
MSTILVVFLVLLTGIVSADTPIAVGGGWVSYYIPSGTPPVASTDNPFTYSAEGPTHIMITDMYCTGDQPAVYEGGVMLGAGNPVVSGYPSCSPYAADADTAYAGVWSHTCIDMPAGRHSFDIMNIQMWDNGEVDGGAVKVEEGVCPGTQEAPEFPTLALPLGMLLGIIFVVYSLRRE